MWDFFIAYSSADRAAAGELHRCLTKKRVRVFLDVEELAPGTGWGPKLKSALTGSRITVVLISRHADKAWYQQEEIAIAISLVRENPTAHWVVPVLLRGGRMGDVPYGLHRLTLAREDELGMEGIVRSLLGELKRTRKAPGTVRLGRSVGILDELWSRMEPALLNKARRMPEEHRVRYQPEGSDLVMREHGRELRRITRAQFKKKLSPEQMEYVETLERSMAVNRVLWNREHPQRVLSSASKRKAKRAMAAMAEDLGGVLEMVKAAGFWLDDHYETVRQIVERA